MDDNVQDPEGVNAFLDSIPPRDEAANIVPFKPKGEDRAKSRPDLPVITLEAGELHNIATEAETALISAEAPFYVRGGKLMRPLIDDLPASGGRRTKVARLSDVTEPTMIDRLSRAALWLKWDARSKKYLSADPTPKVAATVLSRDGEWRFPHLSGVITTPTMRHDGTILSAPGYDVATHLLLLDPPVMPDIPAAPTKTQAQAALGALDALLDEFPFVDDASRSVAMSALITPVVRGAVATAPMHVTKAPVAGSGKSYIIDIASAINSGERAPVVTAGRTEEETEKRLVAALLTGQTIVSIDNVNGELGGDFLCQMIERPVVSCRPLGQSSMVKIENRASSFATGNNIRLVGDMTRRVLICSLDPDMERPELRTFKANPFEEVLSDRGKYVAAALTIVRSYVVAGFPDELPRLASFEDWSRIVRSAIVWLGWPDPVETMNSARADDPIATALRQLLHAWYDAVQSNGQTAVDILETSRLRSQFDSHVHAELRDALIEVAGDRRGDVSARSLGSYLAKYKNRVADGFKILDAGKDRKDKTIWKVIKQ